MLAPARNRRGRERRTGSKNGVENLTLSEDWLARWGHPVALVETFVDPEFFRGTTSKASGWSELGPTCGFGRRAQDFYQPHERPKQLWVKELVKGACQLLRAEQLPVSTLARN